jgi:hypothetical protein
MAACPLRSSSRRSTDSTRWARIWPSRKIVHMHDFRARSRGAILVLSRRCWRCGAWLALIGASIAWLLSLPLRLIGVCVESILALLRALLLKPARVLGHRG